MTFFAGWMLLRNSWAQLLELFNIKFALFDTNKYSSHPKFTLLDDRHDGFATQRSSLQFMSGAVALPPSFSKVVLNT